MYTERPSGKAENVLGLIEGMYTRLYYEYKYVLVLATSLFFIALFALNTTHAADTVYISNSASASVNTGNQQGQDGRPGADGADGRDGRPGQDGMNVTTGSRQASASVDTVVAGNRTVSSSTSAVATSSFSWLQDRPASESGNTTSASTTTPTTTSISSLLGTLNSLLMQYVKLLF